MDCDYESAVKLLAVDPGERHVGCAIFWGRELVETRVLDPEPAVRWIWQMIENAQFELVIVEQWRNYGAEVTWSECTTVEVIGAIKHMCVRHSVQCLKQPALVKRPARARMRAHGIDQPDLSHITKDQQIHASDAVAHGWWWLLEQMYPQGGTLAEHIEAIKPAD